MNKALGALLCVSHSYVDSKRGHHNRDWNDDTAGAHWPYMSH